MRLFEPRSAVDRDEHISYRLGMREYKINKQLGKRVKKLRRERKISQEALAEKAGIHRTYMGKIERGENNPPVHTVDRIAKALKVKISDLFS